MPDSSSSATSTRPVRPAAAEAAAADEPRFPLDVLRVRADRLARAAREAARQHERFSELCCRADVDEPEMRGVAEITSVADRLLHEAAAAYEKASAKLHPEGDDVAWWHRANALWMAARDQQRRLAAGEQLARRLGIAHSADRLAELAVEYSLEASAVLALRQAADDYCRARPTASK